VLETAQGHGIASALLSKLASLAEEAGYWTLQSHVISANIASLALHQKAGFREVGYRERYGAIDDTWHNVILLERRSKVAGGTGLPTKSCR